MTEIRLLGRTHYQVLEPALLRLLIQTCTSPVNSAFRDQVARRLSSSHRDVQQMTQIGPHKNLNLGAAGYAVDLAKALRLVHPNLVWTNLGHLLNLVAGCRTTESWRKLNDAERVVFFRLFLEYDGAALIFFAKKIEEQSVVPDRGESWTKIAQTLFQNTYEEYLKFLADTKSRVRLRQLLEKRRRHPFHGKSGAHQSWLHIHALHRLHLVEQVEAGSARIYRRKSQTGRTQTPTQRLIGAIPDLMALERVVDADMCYEVVAEVLGYVDSGQDVLDKEFVDKVRSIYDNVMATGIVICPVQTLTEAIQVQSVIEHRKPPRAQSILARFKKMQRDSPRDIRFHVDRSGFPAYIKMA